MLRSIEKSITSPCWRRSSGTSPIPAAIAAVGDPGGSRLPSISTDPASQRSIPKIARATSVRPAPTRPARATISPLRTWNETSVKAPSRVSRSTFRTTRPGSADPFGNSASMSRPTIARITDWIVSSPIGLVRTWRPSRITVTRWQIAKISSSRCETNRTALPRARSVSTMRNKRSTSVLASAAVGSSITITRAFAVNAFAISTSCWSAIESPRARRSGSSRTPSCSKTPAASRRIRRASMRRKRLSGCTPTKMFSATLRSGKSVGSWKMIAIPAACDCFALSKIASSPSRKSRPASGRWTPARILTSVDLPAPFSPTRPWTSPPWSSMSPSSSACTAPKLFSACSSESSGSRMLVVVTDRVLDGGAARARRPLASLVVS